MNDQPKTDRDIWLLGGATVLLSVFPLTGFLAPIALAVLVYRRDMKTGGVTALVASLAAFILTFNPLMFAQTALFLSLGIVIGGGLRENIPSKNIVITGTIVCMLATWALKWFLEQAIGMPIDQMMIEIWQDMFAGIPGGDNAEAVLILEATLAQTRITFPTSLFLSSLGLTVVTLALTTRVVQKMAAGNPETPDKSLPVRKLPPFETWRFHKGLSVAYVVLWFVGGRTLTPFDLVGSPGVWQIITANLVVLLSTLVTVHGMAVLWHFLSRLRLTPVLRVVIIVFIILVPALSTALLVLGLVDGWIDLRQMKEVRES